MEEIRLTKINSLIEKDHLGDWSPEKDCCLCLTFHNLCRSYLQSQVIVNIKRNSWIKGIVNLTLHGLGKRELCIYYYYYLGGVEWGRPSTSTQLGLGLECNSSLFRALQTYQVLNISTYAQLTHELILL